ncbi:MAG: methyltransferase domain-containing protein, partial [Candidatus Bathyarchaeota archaeon]|nr:methyltransferase domain-containing protein [Candidatus Bathyarchaeota archaeon]
MVEVVKRRRVEKEDDLPEILKSTREYYRAFSEKYEKFYGDWLSGGGLFSDPEYKMGYDRVLTTLVGLVDEGQLIVDVGCGVGTWSILMAGLGAHVIGLDPSIEALSIQRERSMMANVSDKISEIIGDGHYCPFRNDVFDGLTLNWVLAHIPPKENRKFMNEVGRALRGNAW